MQSNRACSGRALCIVHGQVVVINHTALLESDPAASACQYQMVCVKEVRALVLLCIHTLNSLISGMFPSKK